MFVNLWLFVIIYSCLNFQPTAEDGILEVLAMQDQTQQWDNSDWRLVPLPNQYPATCISKAVKQNNFNLLLKI